MKINKLNFLALASACLLWHPPVLASHQDTQPSAIKQMMHPNRSWWKSAVFYQVYLRSFKDSNGDGIGDINGLISKLDYLQQLGVNAIWINPHYESPNKDNGYDISDYRKVLKEFGTMADFDRLIAEMKRRQMRLMIDIVANHTSDQHHWFKSSQSQGNVQYRDFYIWRDGRSDQKPNNYPSFFSETAWEYHPVIKKHYLHYYLKEQPDLNWDNPAVRQGVYQDILFWLNKGVSGLRFDSITTISKKPGLPSLADPSKFEEEYAKGPKLHDYIQELHHRVYIRDDIVSFGEIVGYKGDEIANFIDPKRHELDVAIDTNLMFFDRPAGYQWLIKPFRLSDYRHAIELSNRARGQHGWTTFFIANHDNPRAVSHYGDASPRFRVASAKALATIQMTQPATPMIYQGDEIGMTNYPFQSIHEFQDQALINRWDNYVRSGKMAPNVFLYHAQRVNRDNSRTPMQWDHSPSAGFTTGVPWLTVNPNYRWVNADQAIHDPQSTYHYYQKLIVLRQQYPTLIFGRYRDITTDDHVFAYLRESGAHQYLVVTNFSRQAQRFHLPAGKKISQILIANNRAFQLPFAHHTLVLPAWHAGIYRLQSQANP